MRADAPWHDDVVSTPFPITDGHIVAPTGAGWGITVNEDAAAEHP
jgi:L-alanine-DL-glutamate epimerase-like enolase superfamily enzyme